MSSTLQPFLNQFDPRDVEDKKAVMHADRVDPALCDGRFDAVFAQSYAASPITKATAQPAA